jgi:hypothetical protein
LLPAGANRRVGLAPTGKRRLVTAHTHKRHSAHIGGEAAGRGHSSGIPALRSPAK